jgi:hypothetical protein
MASGSRLEEDLRSHEFRHGVAQQFWRIVDRDGDSLFVEVTACDDRKYQMRLDCSSYGDEPIDGKFVDPETRGCIETAWPRGDPTFEQWVKFKGPDLFICWDQDRTGIARHVDWRPRKAWTKDENQLFRYLDFMRELLHLPRLGYLRL